MTAWWQYKGLRALALVVLCCALYLPGINTLPPFDRDEARFIQATRQMVESGDYIDIRFQDVPRHKKPIGIYWLQAASVNTLGAIDAIWSYRLPSFIGAVIAVLFTAAIGARYFGNMGGLLAGAMLATTLLMGVEARLGKTDAAQLGAIMAAVYVLLRLWQERALPTWVAAGFWLAVGAGVLIKGPIILLVCASIMIGLSLSLRSAAWLKPLQPVWGVPLVLLMVAPWLIAITIKSHGAFWQESVGQDLLSKAAGVQESHGGPPGYYLGTFFLTFWPWAFLLLPGAVYAWQQRRSLSIQPLLVWIVPFWLLFELFPTKLLHYTLPVFPALALLFAAMLRDTTLLATSRLWRFALGLGAAFVLVIGVGIPLAPLFAFPLTMSISTLSIAAGLVLVAGIAVARSLYTSRQTLALGIGIGVLVNFYAAFWGQQFPGMDGFWVSRSAAQLVAAHRPLCAGPVTSIGYAEPSLIFLLGTDTKLAAEIPAPPESGCRLLLVEHRQLENAASLEQLGKIEGFNYSKGDEVALYLLRQPAAPLSVPETPSP